jgi:hypothetical protein
MKNYPSIPRAYERPPNPYIFYKLDGSNLYFKLDSKGRIQEFRSRTRVLPIDHPIFGDGYNYFKEYQLPILQEIILLYKYKVLEVFTEFYGYYSFAGRHTELALRLNIEEEHTTRIIDLCINKRSSLVDIPLYLELLDGKLDLKGNPLIPPLLSSPLVSNFKFPTYSYLTTDKDSLVKELLPYNLQEVPEGIVLKNRDNTTRYKIKTRTWLEKVKSTFDEVEAQSLINS